MRKSSSYFVCPPEHTEDYTTTKGIHFYVFEEEWRHVLRWISRRRRCCSHRWFDLDQNEDNATETHESLPSSTNDWINPCAFADRWHLLDRRLDFRQSPNRTSPQWRVEQSVCRGFSTLSSSIGRVDDEEDAAAVARSSTNLERLRLVMSQSWHCCCLWLITCSRRRKKSNGKWEKLRRMSICSTLDRAYWSTHRLIDTQTVRFQRWARTNRDKNLGRFTFPTQTSHLSLVECHLSVGLGWKRFPSRDTRANEHSSLTVSDIYRDEEIEIERETERVGSCSVFRLGAPPM